MTGTLTLRLPDPALVVLAGVAEAKAAERAASWFAPDDLAEASDAEARLRARRFTVVVLESLGKDEVEALLVSAKRAHAVVALVLVEPEAEDRSVRNRARDLRTRAQAVEQRRVVCASYVVPAGEQVTIARERLPFDRRDLSGPFDVIGDVHGCCDELEELLTLLGYALKEGAWRHPEGRKAVFVGDLVDRGPGNLPALVLVMNMVDAGSGLCVLGNHDYKLLRWFGHGKAKLGPGLQLTVDEYQALAEDERTALKRRACEFFERCPTHLILDDGGLVVAHGGIREDLIGASGGRVEAFTRFGDTTGETDAHGFPVRLDWAAKYTGDSRIVYGHTPTPVPVWRNKTVNVDQGCVFGGWLTAARYPELDFAQVRAAKVYFESPQKEEFTAGHTDAAS